MAKIVRPKLARATKLLTEHQDGSLGQVAAKFGTADFTDDDLEAGWGVCRVSYHVPMLGHKFFATDKCSFTLPLVLPPLQDDWDATAGKSSMPRIAVLDELTLSFDTRSEPAALEAESVDAPFSPVSVPEPNAGRINYDKVGAYNFHVKVMEKQQMCFSTASGRVPTSEIVSLQFTAEQFASRGFRDNPFALSGIAKQMQPYRSYVLDFAMPPPDGNVGIVSLLVTLKLKVRLRQRYAGEQNRPFYATNTAQLTGYVAPVANERITAQPEILGQHGDVQTNIEGIDKRFRDRLEGGVTTEGLLPPVAAVKDFGCYNIVAVPMWGNYCQHVQSGALNSNKRVMDFKYVDTGVWTVPYYHAPGYVAGIGQLRTFDERRISLVQPWAIHHVLVCRNRMDPTVNTMTAHPQSATYYEKVTVKIASNVRSDLVGEQTIAEGDSSAGTMQFVDYLRNRADGENCGPGSFNSLGDWEVDAIPLVGAGGAGYVAQGRPVFVGRTNSGGHERTLLNGATPTLDGGETELHVRYEIGNPAGLNAPDEDPNAVFVGYGGHWVLLCGQKYLTGAPNDVPA